jgi:hypothetical protein
MLAELRNETSSKSGRDMRNRGRHYCRNLLARTGPREEGRSEEESRHQRRLTLLGLDADAAASESRDACLAAGGMREESLRQRPFMCSRRFFSTSFLSSLHPLGQCEDR